MTDKGGMAKNMTLPMNTTVPVDMNMPMKKNMPINMNMPNRTGNGSMSMSDVTFQNIIQNITLNIVLVQNLTEITNTIIPASINATNGIKLIHLIQLNLLRRPYDSVSYATIKIHFRGFFCIWVTILFRC